MSFRSSSQGCRRTTTGRLEKERRCLVNMPGFLAEASLYKTRRHYRGKASAAGDRTLGVLAQATLYCPSKGCGSCVPDPTSSRGGRKCCCFPTDDRELGCDPIIVECAPSTPPPPQPTVDCGTYSCPSGFCCCGTGDCCAPGHACCVHSCSSGSYCCSDGDGCCPNGWKCRSVFGWHVCSPI